MLFYKATHVSVLTTHIFPSSSSLLLFGVNVELASHEIVHQGVLGWLIEQGA
jgi:hypothetical protein